MFQYWNAFRFAYLSECNVLCMPSPDLHKLKKKNSVLQNIHIYISLNSFTKCTEYLQLMFLQLPSVTWKLIIDLRAASIIWHVKANGALASNFDGGVFQGTASSLNSTMYLDKRLGSILWSVTSVHVFVDMSSMSMRWLSVWSKSSPISCAAS